MPEVAAGLEEAQRISDGGFNLQMPSGADDISCVRSPEFKFRFVFLPAALAQVMNR